MNKKQILIVGNNQDYINELKRSAMLMNASVIAVCGSIEDLQKHLLNGVNPDIIIASDYLFPGNTIDGLVKELTMAQRLNITSFIIRNQNSGNYLTSKNIPYVFESTPPQNLLEMILYPNNSFGTAGNSYMNNPYVQQTTQRNNEIQNNQNIAQTFNQINANTMNQPNDYNPYTMNNNQNMNNNLNNSSNYNMNTGANYQNQNTQSYNNMQQPNSNSNFGNIGMTTIGNSTFKPITVAIASSKGGVGKSAIAIELAKTLADKANRTDLNQTSQLNYSKKIQVCLVDLNPSFDTIASTLSFILNEQRYPTVSDWATAIERKIFNSLTPDEQESLKDSNVNFTNFITKDNISFTKQEIENLLVRDPVTGLYVLPSIALPFDAQFIRPEYIHIILQQLRAMFDVIIIDTGNNISFFTTEALKEANAVFLVTTPTPPASVVVSKLTKNFQQLQIDPSKFSLIVNYANGDTATLKSDAIAEVLNIPLIATLPFEKNLQASHGNGESFSITHKKSPYTREITKLAQQICPLWHTNSRKSSNNKKRKWF